MALSIDELAFLVWVLHYRNQYTLKDISTVLKIAYWKVKNLMTVYDADLNERTKKYLRGKAEYEEKLISYRLDQERLSSLFWRFKRWIGIWIPSPGPIEPTKPDIDIVTSEEFQDCHERSVSQLNRIIKAKAKDRSRKKPVFMTEPAPESFQDWLRSVFAA